MGVVASTSAISLREEGIISTSKLNPISMMDPNSHFQTLSKSVCLIKFPNYPRSALFGTGFLCEIEIEKGSTIETIAGVFSAYHVLTLGMRPLEKFEFSFVGINFNGKTFEKNSEIEECWWDPMLDITFLKMSKVCKLNLIAKGAIFTQTTIGYREQFNLSNFSKNIIIIQHPTSISPSPSTLKYSEGDWKALRGGFCYEHYASTSSGSSGSPVLPNDSNQAPKVAAVHTGMKGYNGVTEFNIATSIDIAIYEIAKKTINNGHSDAVAVSVLPPDLQRAMTKHCLPYRIRNEKVILAELEVYSCMAGQSNNPSLQNAQFTWFLKGDKCWFWTRKLPWSAGSIEEPKYIWNIISPLHPICRNTSAPDETGKDFMIIKELEATACDPRLKLR